MLRVLHIGLGPVGRRVVHDLTHRRLGRVVAAVDHDDDLVGRPLAEVCPQPGGEAEAAVTITDDLAAAIATGRARGPIDLAIVTTTSDLAAAAPAFRELLRAGLSTLSTCEQLIYPWLGHPELAAELEASAREHGGRLLGTGVNPGFLMDLVPAVATAACAEVRAVRVSRHQDATARRVPFQRKIGAGLELDVFEARRAAGTLRHVGLGESLFLLAEALGLTIDRWHESLEPVVAEVRLDSAVGTVRPGCAAGVRQAAEGVCAGGPKLALEFVAAIGQPAPCDRVVIEGDPPIDLVFRGGVHGDLATSAVLLAAAPRLLEAPPGLHTMLTIPPVRWQAAGLRRPS